MALNPSDKVLGTGCLDLTTSYSGKQLSITFGCLRHGSTAFRRFGTFPRFKSIRLLYLSESFEHFVRSSGKVKDPFACCVVYGGRSDSGEAGADVFPNAICAISRIS